MKKIFKFFSLFLVLVCLIVGCGKEENNNDNQDSSNSYLKEITFSEVKTKLENKESFILEIVQDGCHNCTSFTPRFKSVLNEYKIEAFSLNISYIDNEGSLWLDEYGVDGTPTVIFFTEGEEASTLKRLIGNQPEDKIISKLKANGYITK